MHKILLRLDCIYSMQALYAEMQIICPQVDGKFYFLDENNFSDKDLLMRLTPPDPSQASTDQIQSQGTKQA